MTLYRSPDANTAGGSSPSAQAPSSGGTSAQPSSSSATTQKIDFGMGARQDTPAQSSQTSQTSQSNEDLYGDSWWQTHGEHVFKHPRFKETLGYKKKYEELEPLAQLSESFGDSQNLQLFAEHLGPLWQYVNSLGENANTAWSKIAPILNNFIQTGELNIPQSSSNEGGVDIPEADGKLTALESKLSNIEKKLGASEQEKILNTRRSNLNVYEGMLSKWFEQEGLPEGLKKMAAKIIINDMPKLMPKGRDGKLVHPLDYVSQEAFDNVMKQSVIGSIKEMESHFKGKFTKNLEGDGQPLPDTTSKGGTARPNTATFPSRMDKVARMTKFLKTGM